MPNRLWDPDKMKETKVGFLTLKESFMRDGMYFWVCECECGKRVERREDYLRKGKKISCSCQHPRRRKGSLHTSWKGCGSISGQYFCHLKSLAKIRGVTFTVTIEFLWNLFMEQDSKCALTGLPLCFHGHKDRMNGANQTASLDRINSSRGYDDGNLWWIHKDANRMKNHFPLEHYTHICRLVTEHYGKSTSKVPLTTAT
jgi:hypothetical protein